MSERETDSATRDRPLWTPAKCVEFLLGVSVYAYESGRVGIVSWGEHGGIGLAAWGGLRHLSDKDGRSSTEREVDDR